MLKWIAAFAWCFLLGCQNTGDSCHLAKNNTCDELAGCALGTDSTDCDKKCNKGDEASRDGRMDGVCANDEAGFFEPAVLPEAGSWGTGGLLGTWDGTVQARGSSTSDIVTRHFRVVVPRLYNPEVPTPVLFNLGGFSVDLYYLPEYTELNRAADRNNFIVVYGQPEWRDFGSDWFFAWYVYKNAFTGGWEDNPELEYLQAVSDEVRALYNVDMTRTYVSGHSRGGALSVIAALELPGLFAGFCSQAGFITENNYDDRMAELAPDYKTPGYLLHGQQDPDVPVSRSDTLSDVLLELGWEWEGDYTYNKLDGVTHEWQPQYNQEFWDYLSSRELPLELVSP